MFASYHSVRAPSLLFLLLLLRTALLDDGVLVGARSVLVRDGRPIGAVSVGGGEMGAGKGAGAIMPQEAIISASLAASDEDESASELLSVLGQVFTNPDVAQSDEGDSGSDNTNNNDDEESEFIPGASDKLTKRKGAMGLLVFSITSIVVLSIAYYIYNLRHTLEHTASATTSSSIIALLNTTHILTDRVKDIHIPNFLKLSSSKRNGYTSLADSSTHPTSTSTSAGPTKNRLTYLPIPTRWRKPNLSLSGSKRTKHNRSQRAQRARERKMVRWALDSEPEGLGYEADYDYDGLTEPEFELSDAGGFGREERMVNSSKTVNGNGDQSQGQLQMEGAEPTSPQRRWISKASSSLRSSLPPLSLPSISVPGLPSSLNRSGGKSRYASSRSGMGSEEDDGDVVLWDMDTMSMSGARASKAQAHRGEGLPLFGGVGSRGGGYGGYGATG